MVGTDDGLVGEVRYTDGEVGELCNTDGEVGELCDTDGRPVYMLGTEGGGLVLEWVCEVPPSARRPVCSLMHVLIDYAQSLTCARRRRGSRAAITPLPWPCKSCPSTRC